MMNFPINAYVFGTPPVMMYTLYMYSQLMSLLRNEKHMSEIAV